MAVGGLAVGRCTVIGKDKVQSMSGIGGRVFTSLKGESSRIRKYVCASSMLCHLPHVPYGVVTQPHDSGVVCIIYALCGSST